MKSAMTKLAKSKEQQARDTELAEKVTDLSLSAVKVGIQVAQFSSSSLGQVAGILMPGSDNAVSLTIGSVCSVGLKIHQQVELVVANRAQCKQLGIRVKTIQESVKGLEEKPNNGHYLSGLQCLEETLRNCLRLVSRFSKKNWFKRVLMAGTDSKSFIELYQKLDEHVQTLQLGLATEQLNWMQAAQEAQEQDNQELLQKQDEIIRLNQELKEDVSKLALDQKEFQKVMKKQMESMLLQFQESLKVQCQPSYQVAPENTLSLDKSLLTRFHKFTILEKIGDGSLGTVYFARWKEQEVAIKMIEGNLTPAEVEEFTREVQITSRIHSPHIVQLYGVCIEPTRACMVLEYMAGGNLKNYLQKSFLTLAQRERIALEITLGLSYLHRSKIIHRDLKSANILIDEDAHAKITDFGLAKIHMGDVKTVRGKGSQAYSWLAPEVLDSGLHTEKSDIYSLGMILWEIFTGNEPYAGLSDAAVIRKVTKGDREIIPEYIPKPYQTLIKRCWQTKPELRPDVSEILTVIRERRRYLEPVARTGRKLLSSEVNYEKGLQHEENRSYQKAGQRFFRAAERGHVRAQTQLAMLYLQKKIPAIQENVDDSEYKVDAHAMLFFSSKAGHGRAMMNLGFQLEKGDGVSQNKPQALFWYQEANKEGETHAISRIQRLQAEEPAILNTVV